MAFAEALQIVRQLENRPHQKLVGIVPLGNAAVHQRSGDVLHFLSQQGSAIYLHHLQGALHLMEMIGAGDELGLVFRILDVGFQRLARILEGRVKFLLDPFERTEIDGLIHCISFAADALTRR
ncbi:MAG: hypothetical protein WCC36_11825 [Gammaproteobacteria bacterium]